MTWEGFLEPLDVYEDGRDSSGPLVAGRSMTSIPPCSCGKTKYYFLKDDFLVRYGAFMMLVDARVFIFVYFLTEQALKRMAASVSD